MLIYLLGQAILYIKNKIYKSAKNPLSFTNIDGLADDYRDYFGIFYCMCSYHLCKYTTGTTKEIRAIENEYLDLIYIPGFHFFTLSFLNNYFTDSNEVGRN